MKLCMFSVFDSKAEAFLPPFFCVNRGVALRSLQAAAANPNSDFARFSIDYVLFELGEFDDANAVLSCHMTPVEVCKVRELICKEVI